MRLPVRPGSLIVPSDAVSRQLRIIRRLRVQPFPGSNALAHLVRYRLARSWGVFVHPNAAVGDVRLPHPAAVVIGAGVVVEDGVTLFQNVTLGSASYDDDGYPRIRSGATVFAGASVLGAVEVGEGAVVGAHSLVLHDVPSGATVAGTPARQLSTTIEGTSA